MQMILNSMKLENFKGIKDLHIDFSPNGTNIYGDNAAGKTTIYDAFLWLMFGKDSLGRSDFQVKPLDADNNEIHFLDTMVSANILLDGKAYTLQKKQSEKWVKKRGQAEQEYSGNVSEYWVNEVTRSAADFKKFITGIADEQVFKLITNPATFNAMEWKQRRSNLLDINGAEVDSKVLAMPEFANINNVLQDNTPDDAKKRLLERKKKVNAELSAIPPRIDEVTRSLPVINETELLEVQTLKDGMLKQIEGINLAVSNLKSDDVRATKQRELVAAQNELAQIKRMADRQLANERSEFESQLSVSKSRKRSYEVEQSDHKKHIESTSKQIEALTNEISALRARWKEVFECPYMELVYSEKCPTCGQDLPDEQIESVKDKDYKKWESTKAISLETIAADGKEKSKSLAELNQKLERMQRIYTEDESDLRQIEGAIIATEASITQLRTIPLYTDNPEYTTLQKTIEALTEYLSAPTVDKALEYKQQKAEKERVISECDTKLSRRQQAKEGQERIDQLKARQKELGALEAKTDGEIMMLERYIAERCKYLETSINGMFPTVRWKLFDTQVNGAIVDTCVCTVCGVPYNDLNNAARINAGLEIINVLCGFYGVTVPVFVDNAESVNELAPMESQVIRLIVSHDKQLRIEQI